MNKENENYKEKWMKERLSKRNYSIAMMLIVGLGKICEGYEELGMPLTIILLIFLITLVFIVFKTFTPKK